MIGFFATVTFRYQKVANLTAKEVHDISIKNEFTVPKGNMDHILQRAKDGFFDAMIEPGFGPERERVASILRNLGYGIEYYTIKSVLGKFLNRKRGLINIIYG